MFCATSVLSGKETVYCYYKNNMLRPMLISLDASSCMIPI